MRHAVLARVVSELGCPCRLRVSEAIEAEAIAESAKAARVSPIGESANASIPAKGMICRIVLAPYHTC